MAAAAPALAGPPVGVDVSAPQAGAVLPADAAFGVVGIDGDTFATLNPDFPRQWQTWATARRVARRRSTSCREPRHPGGELGQPGPSRGLAQG